MRKLYGLAIVPVLIGAFFLWPNAKLHPLNTQTTNVAPSTKPTPPLVSPADNPNPSNPVLVGSTPVTPVTPVDTTILETDSSSYPGGLVNTVSFTPTGQWGIDFSYSGTNYVYIRVVSAVSGIPQYLILSHNAPLNSQFSFTEQKFDYPIYLEITATNWHVKVIDIAAGGQTSYHLIMPQTEHDWQCEAFVPHCPFTPDPAL